MGLEFRVRAWVLGLSVITQVENQTETRMENEMGTGFIQKLTRIVVSWPEFVLLMHTTVKTIFGSTNHPPILPPP